MEDTEIEQEVRTRRSVLQDSILITLSQEPAPNIAKLAERIDKKRESVSRSLKRLKEEGLVTRSGRGWYLTETGREEAVAARDRLARLADSSAEASQKALSTMAAVGLGTQFKASDLSRYAGGLGHNTLLGGGVGKYFGSSLLSRLNSALPKSAFQPNPILKELASGSNALHTIRESLLRPTGTAAFLQTGKLDLVERLQRQNEGISKHLGALERTNRFGANWNTDLSGVLSTITGLQGAQARWAELMAEQSRFPAMIIAATASTSTASILEDATNIGRMLERYQSAGMTWNNRLEESLKGWDHVIKSFRLWHVEQLESAAKVVDWTDRVNLRFTLPAVTVRDYSNSVRHYITAETRAEPQLVLQEDLELTARVIEQTPISAEVNWRLERIDPRIAAKRRGVWDALASDGSDKYSQACHSMREALRLLLVALAPNTAGPDETPTRRQRLKHILPSKSFAEYVDAMAGAIEKMYGRLSNIAHAGVEPSELSVYAAVAACECLMLDILVNLEDGAAS